MREAISTCSYRRQPCVEGNMLGRQLHREHGANQPLGQSFRSRGGWERKLYIADTVDNRVLKETFSSGGYTETTVPSSSLSGPEAVTVDGSGNVYIADTGNNRVLVEICRQAVPLKAQFQPAHCLVLLRSLWMGAASFILPIPETTVC